MSCKKGLNWGEEETRTFLELVTEKQIIVLIDKKKHKHIDIFESLVDDMEKRGFSKTAQQMKLKLKNLKLAYFKCKRQNSVSGAAKTTCPFYEQLDILYSTRPNVQVLYDGSGIDTANIPDDSLLESTEDHSNENEDPQESESTSSICDEPPTKKKRGYNKLSGRKSYEAILDKYTENMTQSQNQLLTDIIIKQNDMQKEMIKDAMENQKVWEEEILKKEHAFQKEQMQSFIQGMQAIASPAPLLNYGTSQNMFMPPNYGISTNYRLPPNVKLIPMKERNIIAPNEINISAASTSTSSTITTITKENDSTKA